MVFAQLVIGPPGSGKTTYCRGMKDFLRSKQHRNAVIINLDPANDQLPYECDVDLSELITLESVMDRLQLGPNGALIYCMEFLEKNFDWLQERIESLGDEAYILFDCPGQVELYTHNDAVRNIVARLEKQLNMRLVAVHLVDSHYCSDPAKFISVLLTSLTTMLQISLPHINVLSKIDLIQRYGELTFNLEFYTEVLDLQFLLAHLQDNPFAKKYKKLNEALCGLIEDYSLVSFNTLNIQDSDSIIRLVKSIDKANGYAFSSLPEGSETIFETATAADFHYAKFFDDQEKYVEQYDPSESDQ